MLEQPGSKTGSRGTGTGSGPSRSTTAREVLGRGAAAAADDVDPELADEALVRVGEQLGREVVVRVAVDDGRQPRVRQAREERARVLLQVAKVLGHLVRTGRAVEAEHVGLHRLERGDRGADLRADEHPAGRLHRDLHHQRDGAAGVAHRAAAGDDRGLGLEEVVDRLDEEDVRAAFEETGGLHLVVVAELREFDRAERREPGARAHRADDPARALRGGELVGDLPGDAGRGHVEVEGDVRDPVLGEDEPECPERGGFHRVHADREELPVHLGDEVGPGEHEVLVAALELLAAEVLRARDPVPGPRSRRPRRG